MSSWSSLRAPRVRKYYLSFSWSPTLWPWWAVSSLSWLWCQAQHWMSLCTSFLATYHLPPYSHPDMIIDLFYVKKAISFQACMIHLFTEHLFGSAEILLLVVMAYDCYMAICKPLHHMTIVNQRICILLLLLAWIGGFLHAIVHILFVYSLPFCDPNVIDHFRCDMYPLLKLACTDIHIIGFMVLANDGVTCVVLFTLLLIFCGVNLCSLKNLSQGGRHKALSTCGSHIAVVVLYFVPCIFLYVRPPSPLPINKSLAMFYTIVIPVLNPLIYTLRNEEMQNAMKKLWIRRKWGSKKIYQLFSVKKLLFSGKQHVVFLTGVTPQAK